MIAISLRAAALVLESALVASAEEHKPIYGRIWKDAIAAGPATRTR